MKERSKKPIKTLEEKKSSFYLVSVILLILYIVFLLGKSIWQHYQLNNQVQEIEKQILAQEEKNRDLEEQIKYYQSDSYKEKEARSKLGYKKPGETVIALPPPPEESQEKEAEKVSFSQANWQRWWNFFFK